MEVVQYEKTCHSLESYPAQVNPLEDLWYDKSLLIRQGMRNFYSSWWPFMGLGNWGYSKLSESIQMCPFKSSGYQCFPINVLNFPERPDEVEN